MTPGTTRRLSKSTTTLPRQDLKARLVKQKQCHKEQVSEMEVKIQQERYVTQKIFEKENKENMASSSAPGARPRNAPSTVSANAKKKSKYPLNKLS